MMRALALSLAAATVALSGPSPVSAQEAANGALIFKRCAICHSVSPGSGAAIGPNLAGILGRRAGSQPGFAYSKAMQEAGFDWDAARLDAFIAKPQAVVRGTRMTFMGLADAKERADLIAYLATVK